MKKLLLLLMWVGLSAMAQTKYVGQFVGNGPGVTNLPITALWGSAGTNTAATNGTVGLLLNSAGNGGVYWAASSGASAAELQSATNLILISATNSAFTYTVNATNGVMTASTNSAKSYTDSATNGVMTASTNSAKAYTDNATNAAQIYANIGAPLTNGNSFAATFSNAVSIDAAHFLYPSNLTAGKVLQFTVAGGLTNSGLGAVPINGDTTSTTAAQVNTLFPSNIHTNGNSFAAIFSNAVSVDAAHFLYASNITAAKVLTYTTAGGLTNSGLGAVPINADTTATTAAQVNTLFPGNIHTNGNSFAAIFSNAVSVDAAHFLYPSNVTASRFLTYTVAGGLTNLGISAASPINQDLTASTFAQINALGPSASGIFITNNGSGYTNSGNIQASTFNGDGGRVTNQEVTVYCGFNLTPAFITGVNNVYPFVGNATGGKQTTEGLVAQSIPGGILTNLFVKIYAVPAGTNVVFTVMTNGVASSLTANANGGGAATAVKASDTTRSCTVANGDTISMKIVGNNASASAASVTASWSLMQVR